MENNYISNTFIVMCLKIEESCVFIFSTLFFLCKEGKKGSP